MTTADEAVTPQKMDREKEDEADTGMKKVQKEVMDVAGEVVHESEKLTGGCCQTFCGCLPCCVFEEQEEQKKKKKKEQEEEKMKVPAQVH
jgi:hypothetical protein